MINFMCFYLEVRLTLNTVSTQWQSFRLLCFNSCKVAHAACLFTVVKRDAMVSEGWLYKQKYGRTFANLCLRVDIIQTQTRQALNKHVSFRAPWQPDEERTLQFFSCSCFSEKLHVTQKHCKGLENFWIFLNWYSFICSLFLWKGNKLSFWTLV